MRFDLNMGDGANQIRGFSPGQIKINDDIYKHNVIVTPHTILPWTIESMAQITVDNLQSLLELKPDVVLFGTGSTVVFPKQALLAPFYKANIGFEVMTTAAACRTYNVIMADGRQVVAALLLS